MRASDIFREYVWVLTTIRDAGRISFAEIAARWARASINDGHEPMSRSTFNRHRQAIEQIFGVEIKCDRSCGNKYYIDAPKGGGVHDLTNWLCDSLVTGTLISDFRALSDRIALEPVPTAGPALRMILDAMTQNAVLKILYYRIGDEEPREVTVAPYAVKLFKQRWYMLGHVDGAERLRLFSLERVYEVTVTNRTFEIPEDFSASEYFGDIYGVMSAPTDVECQRVVLRAFGRDRLYLEDLPMHHTQQVIEVADEYTDFELYLKPTPDFAAAILSRGGWVKVLEPQWFADELIDRAGFMLESFETDYP